MKELNRFRQFLAEGQINENIEQIFKDTYEGYAEGFQGDPDEVDEFTWEAEEMTDPENYEDDRIAQFKAMQDYLKKNKQYTDTIYGAKVTFTLEPNGEDIKMVSDPSLGEQMNENEENSAVDYYVEQITNDVIETENIQDANEYLDELIQGIEGIREFLPTIFNRDDLDEAYEKEEGKTISVYPFYNEQLAQKLFAMGIEDGYDLDSFLGKKLGGYWVDGDPEGDGTMMYNVQEPTYTELKTRIKNLFKQVMGGSIDEA